MKRYIVLIVVACIGQSLSAQPWKLKEAFKEAFLPQDDTTYMYQKTMKDGKRLVEAYSKGDQNRKIFDYSIDADGHKEKVTFYDENGKWSYVLSFEGGVVDRLLIIFPDKSLGIYPIKEDRLNGAHTSYHHSGYSKEHGFYKDNARIGEWFFHYEHRVVKEEGAYLGNYNRLVYDPQTSKLITLDRNLDTLKVERYSQQKYESLRKELRQEGDPTAPIELHFKKGLWKYYDETGTLIREETYDNNGKLIKEEKK